MPNFRALPSTFDLPSTLAQRVRFIREYRNMTVKDLSKATRFPTRRIEDIESGLETWFSTADRQNMSRALVVEPRVLEEVEDRNIKDATAIPEDVTQEIGDEILRGVRELSCPVCTNKLHCSVAEALDMDGRPIQLPKAFCRKCPFVLRY